MNSFFLKKGFSLIEFLVVMGILAVLIGLSLVFAHSFQKERILENSAQEIIEVLRVAQSKTLASEGASSFGVNFESDKFTLFKGAVFDLASPDNEVFELPSALTISEINLGGSSFVVFERLSGFASSSGSIKIQMTEDASKSAAIFIDSSGAVNSGSLSVDDAARLKDSRHVHILFSQNTKNSSILSLSFPNDGISEQINYQSYLNADKTEFNWEGTINVNGSGQKLKVHTHQLTESATLFCVHRDRRFNSKALGISLDGENFINYSASGATTPGASLWAAAPEIQ